MKTLRTIAAVIAGYVLYAASSMLLVGPVLKNRVAIMMALALVSLVVIGLFSGFVAAAIAGEKRRLAGNVLALLVIVVTIVNLIQQLGGEPAWYKVGTILLTAPAIAFMGYRTPRKSRQDST